MVRDAKFVLVQRFVDSPMPGGTVLDQHPTSGVQADEGSEIVLTVSRVEATVPRVAAFMVDEAKARLARVGFSNVAVTEEDRDDVPPGIVLRSTPEVGLRADKTAVFTLVVARDPYVKLPADIVGKARGGVHGAPARASACRASGRRRPAGPRRRAPCMSVSPGVGQPIRRGSFVAYKVSTGPKLVAVPQLSRTQRRRRRRRARAPRLHRGGDLRDRPPATCAARSCPRRPTAGTAPEGSTVTLNVGVTGK